MRTNSVHEARSLTLSRVLDVPRVESRIQSFDLYGAVATAPPLETFRRGCDWCKTPFLPSSDVAAWLQTARLHARPVSNTSAIGSSLSYPFLFHPVLSYYPPGFRIPLPPLICISCAGGTSSGQTTSRGSQDCPSGTLLGRWCRCLNGLPRQGGQYRCVFLHKGNRSVRGCA